MTLHQCGQCGTAHDSIADALDCCTEEFDDDKDDNGAAPVAVADGGKIPVCPDCDTAGPKPRSFSARAHEPGDTGSYRCPSCGATFDEPAIREAQHSRRGRRGAAGALEKMDPDELRADGGRVTARQDESDARTLTVEYLRDRLERGESSIVLARHVSAATQISSHRAGRVLARLAGQTRGIGAPDTSPPADLQVERAWDGSSAVRWRVLRADTETGVERGGDR